MAIITQVKYPLTIDSILIKNDELTPNDTQTEVLKIEKKKKQTKILCQVMINGIREIHAILLFILLTVFDVRHLIDILDSHSSFFFFFFGKNEEKEIYCVTGIFIS